jgi:hypothetical protein
MPTKVSNLDLPREWKQNVMHHHTITNNIFSLESQKQGTQELISRVGRVPQSWGICDY